MKRMIEENNSSVRVVWKISTKVIYGLDLKMSGDTLHRAMPETCAFEVQKPSWDSKFIDNMLILEKMVERNMSFTD